MNSIQSLINTTTKQLLQNEVWLYGFEITSFYRMRKMVKREELVVLRRTK